MKLKDGDTVKHNFRRYIMQTTYSDEIHISLFIPWFQQYKDIIYIVYFDFMDLQYFTLSTLYC